MSRKRRKESATGVYHVIIKGINRERIFNQQREKFYFRKIILKHLQKYEAAICAYCIMSNHAHFIIRAELHVLSAFMSVILSEYAVYYNFKHLRNGHVFQNRFLSECIETDTYYWSCLRYIHLNPVKAQIVKDLVRYRHSSIGEYMLETSNLISEDALDFYRKRFLDFNDFESFHNMKPETVFTDIDDEERTQQKELMLTIAENTAVEYKLSKLLQVFEEKSIRLEYIEKVRKILKMNTKEIKELIIIIMNDIKQDKEEA